MLNEDSLYKVVVAMAWWMGLSIPAVIVTWILTRRAIKQGDLPADTDLGAILLDVFLTWPKVYYIGILGLTNKLSGKLLDHAIPMEEVEPALLPSTETQDFLTLVSERINNNPELAQWMYREGADAGDGGIGFEVGKTAGVTYMTIFRDPQTLYRARYADGSFPVTTMNNLDSLHPWMVFDLVSEYPHLVRVFPPRILEKINVEIQ